MATGTTITTGAGSPCGACKFLRRRCAPDCVFAPYFSSDQGPVRFAAIHKVFGASNVSKRLMHLPVSNRSDKAQARISNLVYGCVTQILALQQQVAILQAQLMQAKAQLDCGLLTTEQLTLTGDRWHQLSISTLLHGWHAVAGHGLEE